MRFAHMEKVLIKCSSNLDLPFSNVPQKCQGFFQGMFRAVKRPQKLNLELSFETQSFHQSFSAVKMKLFELNS